MTRSRGKIRPIAFLRYFVGISLLMMAVLNGLIFEQPDWARSLGFATAGLALIVIGSGRIFRPGVKRLPDGITCRFVPWYEGNPYGALIVVPLLGLWMIASASPHPGTGNLFRYLGMFVVAVTPFSLFYFVRESRRSFLTITQKALTLPLPARGYKSTEICRDNVRSIAQATGSRVNEIPTSMVEIAFNREDSSNGSPESVMIGPSNSKNAVWLTVEPANLLAALQVWKEAGADAANAMDRVDAILRGHGDDTQQRERGA